MIRILLVDNYDSFTYNLQHLVQVLNDVEVVVCANDEDLILTMKTHNIDGVIIGPGPGSPEEEGYFGNNNEVISYCIKLEIPIFGVCLGYQGINTFFGGKLLICPKVFHGKTSSIEVTKKCPLFYGLPRILKVMRYHSLMIDSNSFPKQLEIVARVVDPQQGSAVEIMAIQHRELPIFGVQFHPESFVGSGGQELMANFIDLCRS